MRSKKYLSNNMFKHTKVYYAFCDNRKKSKTIIELILTRFRTVFFFLLMSRVLHFCIHFFFITPSCRHWIEQNIQK